MLELQLLQHAEQFHLHRGAGGADFVEEDRAAVGLEELAHLFAGRAGEGAGDVAEQFAFEQCFRKGAAGDFDERTLGPAAAAVDRPGDHAFAGAAFAGDQHGGPRVGDAADHLEDFEHPRVAADDVVHAVSAIELGAEVVVFLANAALRNGPLDRHQQFVVDQRLGDVIERTGANRFDRAIRRAVARHQDDLRGRPVAAALLEQIEAVAIAEADVGQHEVERIFAKPLERIDVARRCFQLITLATEPLGHRIEHVAIVVNKQQIAIWSWRVLVFNRVRFRIFR